MAMHICLMRPVKEVRNIKYRKGIDISNATDYLLYGTGAGGGERG